MRSEIEDGMGFAGLAPTASEKREEAERSRLQSELSRLRDVESVARETYDALRYLYQAGIWARTVKAENFDRDDRVGWELAKSAIDRAEKAFGVK